MTCGNELRNFPAGHSPGCLDAYATRVHEVKQLSDDYWNEVKSYANKMEEINILASEIGKLESQILDERGKHADLDRKF